MKVQYILANVLCVREIFNMNIMECRDYPMPSFGMQEPFIHSYLFFSVHAVTLLPLATSSAGSASMP